MALAIFLGIAAGLGTLVFTHKRPAEAGNKVSLLDHQRIFDAPQQFGQVRILPTLSRSMNVLVLGVDSNGRDCERFENTRSDTIMLVHLDPMERRIGLVSIPRDTRVTIAGTHTVDKINAAHAYGGPERAIATVAETFSVPIDHYIVVDAQGLRELCELLGPVEVLVEKEMRYRDRAAQFAVDLQPGLQALDAEKAEEYVRFRNDAKGDIGRIERQQWFLRQAALKLKEPQTLLKLPEIIKLAHQCVRTDLSAEDMIKIAVFGRDVKPNQITSAILPGEPQAINGISYWEPNMRQTRATLNRILGIASGGDFAELPEYITTLETDEDTRFPSDLPTSMSETTVSDATTSQPITVDSEPLTTVAETPTILSEAPRPVPATTAAVSETVSINRQTLPATSATTLLTGSSKARESQQRSARDSDEPRHKKLSVALKYACGSDHEAEVLARTLEDRGYRVRYRWRAQEADCQHEHILVHSAKVNDFSCEQLRSAVPELTAWPTVLSLESRPAVDFTLVISPRSTFLNASANTAGVPTQSQIIVPNI